MLSIKARHSLSIINKVISYPLHLLVGIINGSQSLLCFAFISLLCVLLLLFALFRQTFFYLGSKFIIQGMKIKIKIDSSKPHIGIKLQTSSYQPHVDLAKDLSFSSCWLLSISRIAISNCIHKQFKVKEQTRKCMHILVNGVHLRILVIAM